MWLTSPVSKLQIEMTFTLCLTDVRVIWAGGRTNPPLDKPKCGWENELCIEQDRHGELKFNSVILPTRLLLLRLIYEHNGILRIQRDVRGGLESSGLRIE